VEQARFLLSPHGEPQLPLLLAAGSRQAVGGYDTIARHASAISCFGQRGSHSMRFQARCLFFIGWQLATAPAQSRAPCGEQDRRALEGLAA